MGRPSAAVFEEFVKPLLKRVDYLEVEAGNLEQQILHAERVVKLTPISPMGRAQSREKVIQATSLMETAFNLLGPEQGPLVINGPDTMLNLKNELGDELVKFRTPEEIAQIMQNAQPTG